MKLLFDLFPIVVFFISYKFFGIYVATGLTIAASTIQMLTYRITHKKFEKTQVFSTIIILILGSATLIFHNPVFIKWKPTGIYWVAASIFLWSTFSNNIPLVQKIMGKHLNLPDDVWKTLNYAWSAFFILMGALNIYIAYYFDTNTWVNFKLFGSLGCSLLFVCAQAIYLNSKALPLPQAQKIHNGG